MTNRELVLNTHWMRGTNRIPVGYHLNGEVLMKYGQTVLDIVHKYPNSYFDSHTIQIPQRDEAHYQPDGTYYKETTDEWGCRWRFLEQGISGEVMDSPLKDWSQLKDFKCPSVPNSPEDRKRLKERMDAMEAGGYVRWGRAGSLFEQMQRLRGVEQFFMDVALYPEEVCKLADMIVGDFLVPHIEMSREAGAEVIQFGDDWGTQQALLINPRAFREIFKPRYAKMFELARSGGALIWMHSDGMILEIIPDLIEIGLNVINPQGSCIDLVQLREATKGKLSISMDTDRQFRLPFGTPDEIDAYVKHMVDIFGDPRGGFSLHAAVDAQMPLENIEACLNAFYKYGKLS